MVGYRFNRRLDVYRAVPAPDGAGGQRRTWSKVGEIRAQVSQPSAYERVLAERAGSRHDHYVHTGPGEDVRRGDRLRDAGAAPDSEPYLDVVSTVRPSRATYLRVECELIEAEVL